VEHIIYDTLARMREWSTLYLIIGPEFESGAHCIEESSQSARAELAFFEVA
jgi:hypothetical protein